MRIAFSTTNPVRSFERHQYLAREGEHRSSLLLIEEGWACRFRMLADGRRHIVAFFLRGDLCEPHWALAPAAPGPVLALTPVQARAIPIGEVVEDGGQLGVTGSQVVQALVENSTRLAEWTVSLGRKTATERICELFCNVFERLQASGVAGRNTCPFPLTQHDLADATGLTPVHVNRLLTALRRRGMIELRGKILKIPDIEGLRQMAALPRRPSNDGRPEFGLRLAGST